MGKEGGGEEEAAEMTSSARPTLLAMDIILTLLVLIAPGLLSLEFTIQKSIKICPTRSCHLNRRLWNSLQRGRFPPAPNHLLKILPMCQMERGTGTGELGMDARECR